MRKRIFRSMCALAGGICLFAYASLLLVFNYVYALQTAEELENETWYVAEAVNAMATEEETLAYMQTMQGISNSRITWIAADGTVLFDSVEDEATLENHLNRPEVQSAIAQGYSSEVRNSTTLKESTFYYAVLLDNGTILRLSMSVGSIFSMFFYLLPVAALILIVFIVLIMFLARKITDDIIRPINNLDLENPEMGCPYIELKPLIKRIQKSNEERRQTELMRQEFSANVSHELKTPLTTISGYAELMKDGMVQQKDVPAFAEKIYKEAARLIGLVNDIIKLSRLDEHRIEPEMKRVNLYRLAQDICSRLEGVAAWYHVTMDVEGSPVYMTGNLQLLDELLYNLCENAVKYNRVGGKVHVHVTQTQDTACLIVEDNGIGIPKEHQERVFERFYRVDKSHSRQSGGTGLGMAIAKHAAEYHNGKITLESEEGVGTKITVSFPVS